MTCTETHEVGHSQSQVERVFDINADIMVENLFNDSYIAKIIVNDHMKSKDLQPSKIKLNKRDATLQLLPIQNIRQLLRIKKKWLEG